MPRVPRAVFPGVPHHVVQRGNHREQVFCANGDCEAYLSLLHAYSRQQAVEIVAYCLMPNHVHLVVIPSSADGLQRTLRAVHSQYAQRVNRMRQQKGHLWQGRYFSSPLDTNYFLNAVRYAELNPVKAGMCVRAEDYVWSSARAHCGHRFDPLIGARPRSGPLRKIRNWSSWLSRGVPAKYADELRHHASRNLPCGSSEFIAELEKSAARDLQFRPRGGQQKK